MSIMDMNSRMAMAEKLSVQQLQQAVQSGSLPAYIGIPLIEQKTKEKAQMAAAQQGQEKPPSVVANILQQAEQQQQQEQGIDQLPSNLPVEGAQQGMAGGGIVAFADEGQVVDPNVSPMSKYGNIPAMSPEGRATFDEYSKELKELRGKGGSEREQAKNFAIFQAGLGMMGGTSPNAFANIAAGAMPAVTQYQSALKDIRKEDRDTLKQLLDLGMSKEKFLIEANKMGIDVYKADKAYDATIGAAGIRAAGEKAPRAPNPTDIAQDYINGKTQAYIAAGMNPNLAKTKAQEDYYAQSRPMQPNAAIETGLTARLERDEILRGLAVDRYRYSRDPVRLKQIDEDIKKRQGEIRAEFSGGTSQGRGIGDTGGGGGANPPPAGGSNPPPPAGGSNPPPPAGGSANIPPAAVEMLRGDPSPERRRLFDATFGAGASARVLK
jgi:hypothetical protein